MEPSDSYTPRIDLKWQSYWKREGLFRAPERPSRPTSYVLDMFPYPSGAGLHVGHPLGYIASDIYARYKRMKGFDVLHPMGFDAFGLPAEQYAIETGQHPLKTTSENIRRYRAQLERLGLSYDWSREVRTSDPSYYRWTQWMFTLFFESWYNRATDRAEGIETLRGHFEEGGSDAVDAASGPQRPKFTSKEWRMASEEEQSRWLLNYRLAYLDDAFVNWCPELGTVLSKDEVKDGYSERGGHPVVQKRMRQWMLRVTAYADRLLRDAESLDWPASVLEMQKNWIGRSEGVEIDFQLEEGGALRVFTTRVDTIYGATFVCVSLAQALSMNLSSDVGKRLEDYASTHTDSLVESSTFGLFTGLYALHPLTAERLPVWVADYVLEGYGTGAVMAVPAHDARDYDFATRYQLPIRQVIEPPQPTVGAYEGRVGRLIGSGSLDGCSVEEAQVAALPLLQAQTRTARTINYKLRDAIFARQRYWGEPLPIFYRDGLPQALSAEELPLELPEIDAYLPTQDGDPPLARAAHWKTPNGHPYEQSTMPGWAGSSWYFFRYMDPKNSERFCSQEALAAWRQVDIYFGGAEHAVGHLIYARVWTKLLFDRGLVPVSEFAKKLVNQGMIYGTSYFVYRIPGTETYVSYGLRNQYKTTALHIEHTLVSDGILDIEAFRRSRASRRAAQFLLENEQYLCGSEIEKMSKSKFNVVNPDELLERYGADTLRLYEMFLGPLEQNKPWDTRGIEGIDRFLKKVWRLFHPQGLCSLSEDPPTREELRILHQVIRKVAHDTDRLAFNTSISAMMIAVNGLLKRRCQKRFILEPFLLLLAPYAPHISEELWHRSGHNDSVTLQSFPTFENRYIEEESYTYPLSVNGKVRASITLPADLSKEELKKQALAHEKIRKHLKDHPPQRVIIIPGRMINIVC